MGVGLLCRTCAEHRFLKLVDTAVYAGQGYSEHLRADPSGGGSQSAEDLETALMAQDDYLIAGLDDVKPSSLGLVDKGVETAVALNIARGSPHDATIAYCIGLEDLINPCVAHGHHVRCRTLSLAGTSTKIVQPRSGPIESAQR